MPSRLEVLAFIFVCGGAVYRLGGGLPRHSHLGLDDLGSTPKVAEIDVDTEIEQRKERVAALRIENDGLVKLQDKILQTAARGGTLEDIENLVDVGGSGGKFGVGSAVTFKSSATGKFLSLEKGQVVLDDGSAPLALRTFSVVDGGEGWVGLRAATSSSFLELVPRNQPLAWVVRAAPGAASSDRALFRLEDAGGGAWQILNKASGAYINVITNGGPRGGAVRGHGNGPLKSSAARASEPTTVFEVVVSQVGGLTGPIRRPLRDGSAVMSAPSQGGSWGSREALLTSRTLSSSADGTDAAEAIRRLPSSNEKRVVAYTLFGADPKYLVSH